MARVRTSLSLKQVSVEGENFLIIETGTTTNTTTSPTSPSNTGLEGMAIIGLGSGIIGLVVVVIFLKRKAT